MSTIRKAARADLDAVCRIYDQIHTAEERGEATIGWQRGVYPERETAEAALGTVDLDSMLGTLDPLDKMLFTLRYEEGYNASELGRKFELPPGTVRTRLGKVRHLLKQKLLEE